MSGATLHPYPTMRLWPGLTLCLAACAPRLVLPPISPDPRWSAESTEPAVTVSPVPAGASEVRTDYDLASDFTRRAVTTHAGIYSGWVSKPQITFFALSPGHAPPGHLPARIGLVFRTFEPQAVMGNQLLLTCPGRADSIGVPAASHVVPTGNTHSHFLTYLIPVANIAAFGECPEGTLAIAQIRVSFTGAQLGGIRALLMALGGHSRPGAP